MKDDRRGTEARGHAVRAPPRLAAWNARRSASWLLVTCASCAGPRAAPSALRPAPSIVADDRPARRTPPQSERRTAMQGTGPGFPDDGPWVAFYGTAQQMGDLSRVARTFRIIDIDADPADGGGNFTDAQIAVLKAGGANRVLSYLNLGSCERFRTYWRHAAAGIVPCGQNRAAWLGAYDGYPDETWMDLGNPEYQRLIVDYVAPRLAARGVDGFYLDNLEITEHASPGSPGWCPPACRQGALDVVRRLRERFPEKLLVMQNATSDATRLATTGGLPFATLLDGVTHEEVYSPAFDDAAEGELLRWRALGLRTRNGRPLFIGIEDYVGTCQNVAGAKAAYAKSRVHGFSPYASDASDSQKVVCYWPF